MKKLLFLPMIILLTISGIQCSDNDMTAERREGYIETEGGKVWYCIEGAEKPNVPLIIVHGGPGASHDYLLNLGELANGRPVVFYDQLGCGNSDKTTDTAFFNIDYYTSELNQLINELGFKSFHLLGQSWGGYLCVNYLLRFPSDKVKSLTLSAPLLSTSQWIADQQYWISQLPQSAQNTIAVCESNQDYTSPAYLDAMTLFYEKHLCRISPMPENLEKTFQKMNIQIYNHMWGPSEFTVTGSLLNAGLTDELDELKVPCLLSCGEFDEARPETMKTFMRRISGSRLIILENASHSHHIEKERQYLTALREFLYANDRYSSY